MNKVFTSSQLSPKKKKGSHWQQIKKYFEKKFFCCPFIIKKNDPEGEKENEVFVFKFQKPKCKEEIVELSELKLKINKKEFTYKIKDCYLNTPKSENVFFSCDFNKIVLDQEILTFYNKRNNYFRNYDGGVKIDYESWYGFINLAVFDFISTLIETKSRILDVFGNVGVNAINVFSHFLIIFMRLSFFLNFYSSKLLRNIQIIIAMVKCICFFLLKKNFLFLV